MSVDRSFVALIKYHVVAAMSMTRWRFVPPLYLLIMMATIPDAVYVPRGYKPFTADANVWDVGLRYLHDPFNYVLILLFGLILLVGDDLVRGHQNGTMRSTLLLSRSISRWWRAKVIAMGVCTFAYMGIGFVATILASLVMGIRFELGNSGASSRLAQLRWYHLPAGWSTLGYEVFSIVSMALTMWAVVVLYQALSLFVFPNRRIPLFAFFTWAILGFVVQNPASWWDLRFLLYPGKCFSEFGSESTSIPMFFGFVAILLIGATALGQARLKRMDF